MPLSKKEYKILSIVFSRFYLDSYTKNVESSTKMTYCPTGRVAPTTQYFFHSSLKPKESPYQNERGNDPCLMPPSHLALANTRWGTLKPRRLTCRRCTHVRINFSYKTYYFGFNNLLVFSTWSQANTKKNYMTFFHEGLFIPISSNSTTTYNLNLFQQALINSFFVNMAIGPNIAKTCCNQSGATAVAYLGVQRMCRNYSNINQVW